MSASKGVAKKVLPKPKGKEGKILVTTPKPDKVSVQAVKTSALRRAEILSLITKEGFGFATKEGSAAKGLVNAAGKLRSGARKGLKSYGKLVGSKTKPGIATDKERKLFNKAKKKGVKSKKGAKALDKFKREASKKTVKHLNRSQKFFGKLKDDKGNRIKLSSAQLLGHFLKRALTKQGSEQIIKQASDRERAARVLSAVHKAARSYGR